MIIDGRLIANHLFCEAKERGFNVKYKDLYDDEVGTLTPLGYILYMTNDYNILKHVPGDIVIKKGDGSSPFYHQHVILYHDFLRKVWKPSKADFYIFMSCTRVKPYSKSITHKMMLKYVQKLNDQGIKAEIFSISEPMLIVPQRYEHLYPLANYDFPPRLMENWEQKIMISEIAKLLPKLTMNVEKMIVAVLPKHHYNIMSSALNGINNYDREKIMLLSYGYRPFRALRKTYEIILLEENNK